MAQHLPHPVVLAQASFVLLAFGLLALWPPKEGAMLVMSLSGRAAPALNAALAADARLLGAGPAAGSIVVDGERTSLLRVARRHGLIVVAAPAAWCGASAGPRRNR